jgi:type IV pilus assembly protein PilQ
MGKKIEIRKKRLSSFLIYPAIVIMWSLSGCATQPTATSEITADNTSASMMEQDSIAQKNEMPEYQTEQLAAKISEDMQKKEPEKAQFTESEPRILFEPTRSNMNQVLGIDFTMLDIGKSRLTVTTDKKVTYDLDRKGDKDLVLRLHNTTIPSLLLREIDTTNFQTALDKVKPAFSTESKEVSLAMSLREMTPFHIKQTENGLSIDFDQTSIKPPDKKIIPLDLAEAQTSTLAAKQASVKTTTGTTPATGQKKAYTGEKMHLEFINADITYVLQLIYEISKENIIWDPAIKGRTVSMTLKDVPWDEALDLILDSNDLAKRYRGDNIIWITTKEKMDKFLADEETTAKRRQQEIEDERRRQGEEKTKAKEEEPLIMEFLHTDFAKANEIKDHIKVTERGNMSVDTRTNTIIITDTADSIEAAKKTIKNFDTPVKQIMIEARIVDATNQFSRDLGIKWNADAAATAESMKVPVTAGSPVEIVGTGAGHINDSMDGAQSLVGGTFSTNSPAGWIPNIGFSFGRLTASGLGALTLDASLALAETNGTAKTLSAPKVIAQEGANASIVSGETIYTNPTENVAQTSRDAALTLNVKPTSISYNDYVTLEIEVTDNKNVSATLDTTKKINTTLMVKSGETIVIGGIIKESESDNIAGIPILKDIPGLGWLFKAKTKTKDKSELLIFLTPTVLPSPVNEL